MSEQSFSSLTEQLTACNNELYRCCQEENWDGCATLIDFRGKLLTQLSQITPELSPDEIDNLAEHYQNILENDNIYLNYAEAERVAVKKQLRHLKRAEIKALPAYRKHS